MPRRALVLEFFSNNFRRRMGSNSLQGWAVLAMLVAFAALSVALARDSMLLMLVFVIALGLSIALFLKAKPLEI
jgi:hypothetical protein